ncbi:NAD(P)-dependent dehydrogenase (short-subunit alcohol dehydrogenase family) [Paenibacillus sp. RC73]
MIRSVLHQIQQSIYYPFFDYHFFTIAFYDVTFIKTNVADEKSVKSMVEETVSKYGTIDILINNAQATDKSALPTLVEDTTVELMKLCWTTGVLGTFFCTKYIVPT